MQIMLNASRVGLNLMIACYSSNLSWLVVSNTNFFLHFIYGMSSFPLTHIFQDG